MYVARICGHYKTNLQIGLNTQKNPYLNQSTQKSTSQNFLPPKKILRSSRHLKSRLPLLGAAVPTIFQIIYLLSISSNQGYMQNYWLLIFLNINIKKCNILLYSVFYSEKTHSVPGEWSWSWFWQGWTSVYYGCL